MTLSRLFSQCALLFALLGGGFVGTAHATKPLAPTDVAVSFSRAGDGDADGAKHSFLVQWADQAFDEEGFQIEVRGGNAGPWNVFQRLGANAEAALVTLQALPVGLQVQFRVGVYKFNGKALEVAYSKITSFLVPDTADDAFAAPKDLAAELEGDGVIKLTWTDDSTSEVYHQIEYREQSATPGSFLHAGYVYFNIEEAAVQLGLVPGRTYELRVSATRAAPSDGTTFAANLKSDPSNTVEVTIPALAKPENLQGSVKSESVVELTWQDKSTNETGYQVERRLVGSTGAFASVGTIGANTTSVTVPTTPGQAYQWQMRAVYDTSLVDDPVLSDPSNTTDLSNSFPAPSELVATTSAVNRSVELTWKDNSESEGFFEILTRPVGATAYILAMTVPAGTTSAIVSSRSSGSVALEVDAQHEFVVRAGIEMSSGESDSFKHYSSDSNTAQAAAKHGFTSRLYHPATVGVALTPYKLEVAGNRTAWSVTGLPPGLSFDDTSGEITGTPTTSGIYECPITATYSNGWVASTKLVFRVRQVAASPVVAADIPDTTIAPNTNLSISLAGFFADPEAERAVRLATTKGDINLVLYPSLAPAAVANFMAYVAAGDYDGVSFHRAVPGFVVQGGGFTPVAAPDQFFSVPARPSPRNEPGISNVRGTIASAKLGGNPHSATHDFFLNLADNNDPINPQSLDNQNGGFTAFGRIAGTGMSVVDAIAALPRKSYNVVVDGSIGGFSDWPMDVTGSPPSTMDVSKTVRINTAREILPLTYSVTDNSVSSTVSAVINGDVLGIRGLQVGTSTLTIAATDLDGNSVSQQLVVTVTPNYKQPVISRHPVTQVILPGGKATFKVTASGTALTYQWRKDGAALPGATSSTLVLTDVQADQLGTYDVLVGNASTTLVSAGAELEFRALPAITTQPESKLVNVGDPLALEIATTGAPVPSVSWKRDGRAVRGQSKAKLEIAAVSLADAGAYVATAANAAGKTPSSAANVYVVDAASAVTTAKPGAKVVLKAAAAGPDLEFQWLKDGQVLPDDGPLYSGSRTATLTITAARLGDDTAGSSDSGLYTCRVTRPGGLPGSVADATTGAHKLAVVVKPTFTDYTANSGVVGFPYDYTIPQGTDVTQTASDFTLSGLPPGLTYDKKTGRITGTATKAGSYSIRTTVRNAAGSSTAVTGTLDILPMPSVGVGTFVAGVSASALNDNLGGRLDLIVRDSGAYTGKLTLGSDVYPVAGSMTYFPGLVAPQSQVEVKRKGKSPLRLTFVVQDSIGTLGGQVTDGASVSTLTGVRQFWHATWSPSFLMGTYNLSLNLPVSDAVDLEVPQGAGFATVKVSSAGVAKIVGKLADGTAFTSSSLVGLAGQFLIYQTLYSKTGSVLAMPNFSNRPVRISQGDVQQDVMRLDGTARWVKKEQAKATERTYKPGFGPLNLDIIGRTYFPPVKEYNPRLMELPGVDGNAELKFASGGVEASDTEPDVVIKVPDNNVPVLPVAGSAENPAKVKLKLNSSTGAYNGTFELTETGSSVKRVVPFQGLVVQRMPETPEIPATANQAKIAAIPGVDAKAVGYFLLPQLADATSTPPVTAANSPILSGQVVLQPASILISSQPQSATVNPGQTASLSVEASGYGTLTYQWRKNGVAINGATGTTLSFDPVAEANQATYQVAISNGLTTTVSSEATLSVNDPITSVGITRDPVGSGVATGGTVTFTAEANGTGPFTYQWYKGGSVIPDATDAVFSIASANHAEHSGTYAVKVSNDLSTDVSSSTITLVVQEPITHALATISPTGSPLGAGEYVTLTASTTSGPAPYTYQWRKDGVPISGATNQTFVMYPITSDHDGVYDVLIGNAATPDGFASNTVTVTVEDGVSGASASRDPADDLVASGTTVTFSASSYGVGPFNYQWRKNGTPISGATEPELVLVVGLSDAGNYDVIISSDITPAGVTSNTVELQVDEPGAITTATASRTPNDATVGQGTEVTFVAASDGTAPFTYKWRRNGEVIPDATSSTYTISASTEHSGTYDVIISNSATPEGFASNEVSLQVEEPAPVTTATASRAPADATVVEGTEIVFTATSDGTGPFTYQWRKNNEEISGMTSSVYTFSAEVGDSGIYDVVISNGLTPSGIVSNQVPLTVEGATDP